MASARSSRPSRLALALAAGLVLSSVQPALATNATNLLGYSAAAQGMAGAASVSVLDTQLINTNPASLFLLPDGTDRDPNSAILGGIGNFTFSWVQPYLHHTDQFGNDRESEDNPFFAIHGGLALRFREVPRLTVGLGIFSQSGVGADFRALRTAFGTRDDVTSYERFVKLQSAISYQLTDDFALGIGPYIGYSDLTLHMFPSTSAPPVFAGLNSGDLCARNFGLGRPGSDCPWSVVLGVKLGATWRITPILTAGVAYTSPASFHYDHGEAHLDFRGAGLGSVRYDASVSGISHPQNVQMGFALRPTPRWLLALDLTWHDWSAFRGFTIKLRHPDTPGAPEQVDLSFNENWRDQFVVALGVAYEVIPAVFTVRGGYNYSNNPSPSATFSPAIQVPFEHHLTAGAGYKFARHWELDAGVVYAFEKKVTYTNQQLPFGQNATESPSGFSVDVTVGYRF